MLRVGQILCLSLLVRWFFVIEVNIFLRRMLIYSHQSHNFSQLLVIVPLRVRLGSLAFIMHLFLNISEQILTLFFHFRHVIGLQTISFLQSLHIHQVSVMFPLSLGSDQFTLFLGSCQFTFVQNVLLIANVLLAIVPDENRWKFSIFLHQRQHYVIHPSISASRTINALSVLRQRAQVKPFEKYRFQRGFPGRSLSRLQNTHKQKPQQMFLQNQQPQNQLTLMIKLQSNYITSLDL